ncbi:MAG TPA: AraC family transcriptional regulator [Mobilitalea sp.]|nr:AraC family transcriptional regulator [Mobilitalea sp.]
MRAWDSIQNTIHYIEENLSEKIDIDDLSKKANLSPFYFQRLFNRLVGKPAMEYIKLRRLANAADYLIMNNNNRIIDVAMEFGFENHETFTRAFKATYGMTPENYRNNPRQLSHFLEPDISLNYRLIDENVPLIADGITLEVSRKHLETPRIFTGMSIQNSIDDTPGVDLLGELWNRFHEQKPSLSNIMSYGQEAGVSSPGERPGCFTYFAGAEVSCTDDIPDKYTVWSMPIGDYIICTFEAENFYLLTTNALNKARDYMFGVWIPAHKLATEFFMAELYYDTTPEASKMEIWLKIKVRGNKHL